MDLASLPFVSIDLNLIFRASSWGKQMLTRKTHRPNKATSPSAQRTLRPAPKPAKVPPGGVSDEDLRKMTAAVLEKLKSPTIPPSVTILEALKQVRDRALAAKAKV
jgi:hypothetical protein